MTKEEKQLNAIWTPGWYELDQTLVQGERRRYWYFAEAPNGIAESVDGEAIDFVFFNQLDSATNSVVRWSVISSMSHPQLGELTRIDTDGLDYIFVPKVGKEVVVNAEEEPGKIYDESIQISDWTVNVTLSEVSSPLTETA